MKKFLTISLTFFLIIGFTFPACQDDDIVDGPLNSCDGVVFLNHFNVLGLAVSSFSDISTDEMIAPFDTITFDELDKIKIDYLVNYIAQKSSKKNWSFSLMPSLMACSYIPGTNGSKNEAIENLTISTLNDFDSDHLADTDIKDLFDYHGSAWERLDNPISLLQFLEEQTGNIQGGDLILGLKKAPEINQEFRLKVTLELSTGEVYEFETEPIIITL